MGAVDGRLHGKGVGRVRDCRQRGGEGERLQRKRWSGVTAADEGVGETLQRKGMDGMTAAEKGVGRGRDCRGTQNFITQG